MKESPTPWADFAFRRASKGDLWQNSTHAPIRTDKIHGVNYKVYGERLSDVCLVVGEINGKLESAFFSNGRTFFIFFGDLPADINDEPKG